MSKQVELSTYDLKATEIFKLIMEDGEPKTSYDLIFKKNQPTATVHRHIDRMIKDNEIIVYGEKKNIRGRKPYGPTLYGIISYYGVDKEFTKNLENYFDLWKENQDFRKALVKMGFDETKMKYFPEECRKMFRTWIYYSAMAESAYDKLAEDPYILSYEGQQFIGGMLIANNKKAKQEYEELYAFSKPFREGVDSFFLNAQNYHNELKNKTKKLIEKLEKNN